MTTLPIEIVVERFSNNELTKELFIFKAEGMTLYYRSHYIMNRSSKKSKWPDEQQKPIPYERWRKLSSTIRKYGHESEWHYYDYQKKFNPIGQKTKDGRSKMSGISASIGFMPSCPASVANKALKIFKKRLVVVFEP